MSKKQTPIGALEEAFQLIREKYYSTSKVEANKDATFNLTLTVNR